MTAQLQRCMLDAAGLAAVAARYAEAASGYSASAELGDDAAIVYLRGPKPELAALLDEMIARESGCCSHLTFDVAETAGSYDVTLRTTPPDRSALAEALSVLFPTAALTPAPLG